MAMTLADQLEELRDNILRDKSSQVSGTRSDQLWTDRTLVRYINEAQDRFAKRSECLRDATTPEVCQIKTQVGVDRYAMHPKVLGVLSARLASGTVDLARSGHANLDTYRIVDNRFFDTSSLQAVTPGKTLAYTTDEGMQADGRNAFNAVTFRVYPMVGAGYADTVNLRVVRLPLRRLHLDDLNAYPEIPEQYHLNMLDWAGYLALRGPDLDVAGGDAPGRAKDLMQSFEQHVIDAKRELSRRLYQPPTWDFGGNGFTYERDWNV